MENTGSTEKRRLRKHTLQRRRSREFRSRRRKIQIRKKKGNFHYDCCRGKERGEKSEGLHEGEEYFKVFPCHECIKK